MKQTPSIIEKTASGQELTPERLEKINAYTRRKLAAEEVFAFSIILCDNEIDRDGERFPRESLEKLAPLFEGKTGVFDHSAQAKNQSARIFECEVSIDEHREAPGGEPYCCLRAWAYMVRCEKNADLILEIDAGIKKEVSVGCAVDRILCSVCGADRKKNPCAHQKGESYAGVLCHHLLTEPTDAYEWSFVAVPAQKNAGVTKGYPAFGGDGDMLERIEKSRGAVELSAPEADRLRSKLLELKALSRDGEMYTAGLRREVIRLAGLANPALDRVVLEEVAAAMDARQLKAFADGMRPAAGKAFPLPQLARAADTATDTDGQFRI